MLELGAVDFWGFRPPFGTWFVVWMLEVQAFLFRRRRCWGARFRSWLSGFRIWGRLVSLEKGFDWPRMRISPPSGRKVRPCWRISGRVAQGFPRIRGLQDMEASGRPRGLRPLPGKLLNRAKGAGFGQFRL